MCIYICTFYSRARTHVYIFAGRPDTHLHTWNHKCIIYSCIPSVRDRRENAQPLRWAILLTIYGNDKSLPARQFLVSIRISTNNTVVQQIHLCTFGRSRTSLLWTLYQALKWNCCNENSFVRTCEKIYRPWIGTGRFNCLIDHLNFRTMHCVSRLKSPFMTQLDVTNMLRLDTSIVSRWSCIRNSSIRYLLHSSIKKRRNKNKK